MEAIDYSSNEIAGTMPDHFCYYQSIFARYNQFTGSVPSCFLCDLARIVPLYPNFNMNPQPTVATCNLQIESFTQSFSTDGGLMEIHGSNIGWTLYSNTGANLKNSKNMPNQVLYYTIPPSTTSPQSVTIYFHYPSFNTTLPRQFEYTINAPAITGVTLASGLLKFTGSSLGFKPNVQTITVAGQTFSLTTVSSSFITMASSLLPYTNDLVFSYQYNVGNLPQVNQIYSAPSVQNPTVSKPYPKLNQTANSVRFSGSYFTFDKSLISVKIFDKDCTVSSSSVNFIECDYPDLDSSPELTYDLTITVNGKTFNQTLDPNTPTTSTTTTSTTTSSTTSNTNPSSEDVSSQLSSYSLITINLVLSVILVQLLL